MSCCCSARACYWISCCTQARGLVAPARAQGGRLYLPGRWAPSRLESGVRAVHGLPACLAAAPCGHCSPVSGCRLSDRRRAPRCSRPGVDGLLDLLGASLPRHSRTDVCCDGVFVRHRSGRIPRGFGQSHQCAVVRRRDVGCPVRRSVERCPSFRRGTHSGVVCTQRSPCHHNGAVCAGCVVEGA